MNRERANELLPVIQAFAEGKAIQNRRTPEQDWYTVKEPGFSDGFEYRIAPEPSSRFLNLEELKQLVGKTLTHKKDGGAFLMTGVWEGGNIYLMCYGTIYGAGQLAEQFTHLNGDPLTVTEEL